MIETFPLPAQIPGWMFETQFHCVDGDEEDLHHPDYALMIRSRGPVSIAINVESLEATFHDLVGTHSGNCEQLYLAVRSIDALEDYSVRVRCMCARAGNITVGDDL